VTADRDAFAKTKPCVEVFTGYQKWRKRGRKVGLGCNAARKMMKQMKGFASLRFLQAEQRREKESRTQL
jgi:hypothetical protein